MTTGIRRRVSLWVAILALAVAATVAYAQFQGTAGEPPRMLQNIEDTSHKTKCAKYKKGSKKKRKCKQDCGVGPGGYGRPNDHPNRPGQCRDW
jgi:hypothetical protein